MHFVGCSGQAKQKGSHAMLLSQATTRRGAITWTGELMLSQPLLKIDQKSNMYVMYTSAAASCQATKSRAWTAPIFQGSSIFRQQASRLPPTHRCQLQAVDATFAGVCRPQQDRSLAGQLQRPYGECAGERVQGRVHGSLWKQASLHCGRAAAFDSLTHSCACTVGASRAVSAQFVHEPRGPRRQESLP